MRRRSISWQSGVILLLLPVKKHLTDQPLRRSRAAAQMPSPPLLPLPQNTRARRALTGTSIAAEAMARAAFVISRVEGMPRMWIASLSASRICFENAVFIFRASGLTFVVTASLLCAIIMRNVKIVNFILA